MQVSPALYAAQLFTAGYAMYSKPCSHSHLLTPSLHRRNQEIVSLWLFAAMPMCFPIDGVLQNHTELFCSPGS